MIDQIDKCLVTFKPGATHKVTDFLVSAAICTARVNARCGCWIHNGHELNFSMP